MRPGTQSPLAHRQLGVRPETRPRLSGGARFVITLLFLLVMLSLAANAYLIWQLLTFREYALELQRQAEDLRQTALGVLSQTIQELETFDEATFEYTIRIDEEIPVQIDVPFRDSMQVPIKATIPINEEIDTTITAQIPQFGLEIPVDVTIPVALDVPVDMVVPLDIDRQVPISTTVPIKLDVPIVIRLSETDLARYVDLLENGLKDFERGLSGIGE